MTTILRSQLDAMTPEQYEAWQFTPEGVRLMPGPYFRDDDTPVEDGDAPLATDYMWTGHHKITVDDEDLAAACAEYPDVLGGTAPTWVYDQDAIDAAVDAARLEHADVITQAGLDAAAALPKPNTAEERQAARVAGRQTKRTEVSTAARVAERTAQRQAQRKEARIALRTEARIAARIAERKAAREAAQV